MSRIRLRALTRADIDNTLLWHNQEEIQNLYSGHPFPVNLEFENTWYDKILTNNFPTTVFGIEHVKDRVLIGLFLLKDISMLHRRAELALYIGDRSYQGKGLAHEILVDGLRFGFNKLGLNRIDLRVLDTNKVAIKAYEKCGFIQEGVLRQVVFKNGLFQNEIMMSLLREEFHV